MEHRTPKYQTTKLEELQIRYTSAVDERTLMAQLLPIITELTDAECAEIMEKLTGGDHVVRH